MILDSHFTRERWLQVLDGRRRQRAAYVRVPTGAPRELDFVGLPLSCRGGGMYSQGDESSHRESDLSAAPKSSRRPRLERRRLRGAAVAAATLEGAAASDRPPTVRPASGGGMFGAHGKIAYLSLPFCALMRAQSARAAAAR